MRSVPSDPDPYEELEAERHHSDMLMAVLRTVMENVEEDTRHIVMLPRSGLCLGHIVDGAINTHDERRRKENEK